MRPERQEEKWEDSIDRKVLVSFLKTSHSHDTPGFGGVYLSVKYLSFPCKFS